MNNSSKPVSGWGYDILHPVMGDDAEGRIYNQDRLGNVRVHMRVCAFMEGSGSDEVMANVKKIKNRKQLIELINKYFDSLCGRPPTVAGLARACGFKSKQSLYEYRRDDKYKDIIDDAILRIEEYTEACLFDSKTARGAEFSLKYNFKWGSSDALSGETERNTIILADIKEEYTDE